MKEAIVYQYDAFSTRPNKGNPAGIVFNGDDFSAEEMQMIAYQVQFNETAFIMKSSRADLRIRYFTPGQEADLCGHATVASLYALHSKNKLPKTTFTVETNAGILPMTVQNRNGQPVITMSQASPQFHPFSGSKETLAKALNLHIDDLDQRLPIVYGSTGNWTLLVPLKNLDACKKMKPNQEDFPLILTDMPKASIHPFCFETIHSEAHMHGRHFSSPFSGTVEDAVTGTASGVMGAYYARYVDQQDNGRWQFVIEQGQEIDKDGFVHVEITKKENTYGVVIAGEAAYVTKQIVSLS
ncbi:PhzF family phenazine biosynthesis isomerase [Priestia megaterium]|uniref:PhzF family phenazine biosynthesis isomerase n=1 Tax=Priestia megaterium TaxID=1404 RepID=UPI001F13D95A|nr:PhzF family phenazine biosynthesis isomerase [Priestia megaterium]MCR8925041.1 PhzF family phenazine biosynthesis isomerase [Priestia megaterium]UMZ35200.1 PhzF family phenazine biosynthesis isomerase [Priestia megaterium]